MQTMISGKTEVFQDFWLFGQGLDLCNFRFLKLSFYVVYFYEWAEPWCWMKLFPWGPWCSIWFSFIGHNVFRLMLYDLFISHLSYWILIHMKAENLPQCFPSNKQPTFVKEMIIKDSLKIIIFELDKGVAVLSQALPQFMYSWFLLFLVACIINCWAIVPREMQGYRFLWPSSHNICGNRSMHKLLLCIFLSKDALFNIYCWSQYNIDFMFISTTSHVWRKLI